MHRALADKLACPSCRTAYALQIDAADGDEIHAGLLSCPHCGVMVPIMHGFALFTEIDIDPPPTGSETRWFGTPAEYANYRQQKFRRDQLEIYAAFHPFNESVRAIDAVLPVLAAGLQPGDAILDPWARTGWSGFRLAQRFPEQRIVALVEGNRDVLGYRGVAHWLAHGRRPANLDVLFVHPGRPLPFADAAFAGVHSHDCLHRFPMEALASELLRVTAPGAPLILAHVHLANSEPDPWFDRGCTIRHGQSYRRWLDRICRDGVREGRVLSEGDLFNGLAGDLPPDSPDTDHYNGLIVVADLKSCRLSPAPAPTAPALRYLLNPLFRLHPGRRSARIERFQHDGMVGALLDRHPIYQQRLPAEAISLSPTQFAIVALALVGRSFDDIAHHVSLTAADLSSFVDPLVAAELLLPVAVSADAVAMQRFHANQLPPGSTTLADFLAALPENGARLLASDGGEVDGSDITTTIDGIATVLAQCGAGPATALGIALQPHPLSLLVILSGLKLGCHVMLGGGAATNLLIVDAPGREDRAATAQIALGWAAEPGSLIHRLETLAPPPPLACRDCGRISIGVDDGSLAISADLLCEMALSLANTAALAPGAGIDSIEGLLACLARLGRGETLTVTG